ncbi:hypothetical protein BBI15_11570 [Planococcus plakortidis]|uniref:Uncharacterized protein n=1 Tax=Planococcus plakortidis TaxID=1038856 RepID=A0A1C7EAS7_9BACL|nr:hypothetical protein BBI15_11570 [Planococcus plakortidis]
MLNCFSSLLGLHLSIRRPALGWPPAISQEEHLSYGIGSPLALDGLEISLIGVRLIRTASIKSCRLAGKSLPKERVKEIVRFCVLNCFSSLLGLHLTVRLPALGWPLAISQEERLSYGIGSPLALDGLEISMSRA